jgi:5'-nucleotidase
LIPAPDGSITFGQIYAAQPFGNTMVVRSFTGRQVKAILEQQWASGTNSLETPNVLLPSAGFTYGYDLSRPEGQRIVDPSLNGEPLQDERVYKVTMNSFLASGGDNFTLFKEGSNPIGGPLDLDVLESYFAGNPNLSPPTTGRIRNLTPS